MSQKKKYIIHVKPDGRVEIKDLIGFGTGCMEASKAIETALGTADEKSRQCTAEFHNTNTVEGSITLTRDNG